MSVESKRFLGVGWKFPVSSGPNLAVNTSEYEKDIEEAIKIILGTAKGERVMRPDFGCGIHNYVFGTPNVTTLAKIKNSIREALYLWEPRIEVINVETLINEIHNGKLIINIEYTISATNNRRNLVYDFYLKEG